MWSHVRAQADLHSRWTLRSVADAWETLQVTLNPGGWFLSVRSPPAPAPLAAATGGGCVPDPDHPAVGYLSPLLLEPGAPLIRRTAPCFDGWEAVVFRLTQVPVVNVSPLVGRALAHLQPEVSDSERNTCCCCAAHAGMIRPGVQASALSCLGLCASPARAPGAQHWHWR